MKRILLLLAPVLLLAACSNNDLEVNEPELEVTRASHTITPNITSVAPGQLYWFRVSPANGVFTWSIEPATAVSQIIMHPDYDYWTGDYTDEIGYVFSKNARYCVITVRRGGVLVTSLGLDIVFRGSGSVIPNPYQ